MPLLSLFKKILINMTYLVEVFINITYLVAKGLSHILTKFQRSSNEVPMKFLARFFLKSAFKW